MIYPFIKLIVFLTLAGVFNTNSIAGSSYLFQVDEHLLFEKFHHLDYLEKGLQEGFEISSWDTSSSVLFYDAARNNYTPPLGMPSAGWGCLFSVAGVALVYYYTEDVKERHDAELGATCNGLTVLGLYIFSQWLNTLGPI